MLTEKQFIRKFIYWFNIYGNLFFFGAMVCVFYAYILWNWLSIIMGIISIIFLICGSKITVGYWKKYQYYKVTEQRILKNGYSDEYFEQGLMDPCYRLLTKQILNDIGKMGEYRRLVKLFGTRYRFILYKAKKLLEKEVPNGS